MSAEAPEPSTSLPAPTFMLRFGSLTCRHVEWKPYCSRRGAASSRADMGMSRLALRCFPAALTDAAAAVPVGRLHRSLGCRHANETCCQVAAAAARLLAFRDVAHLLRE